MTLMTRGAAVFALALAGLALASCAYPAAPGYYGYYGYPDYYYGPNDRFDPDVFVTRGDHDRDFDHDHDGDHDHDSGHMWH